jgi:hypothetical protein
LSGAFSFSEAGDLSDAAVWAAAPAVAASAIAITASERIVMTFSFLTWNQAG